MVISHLFYMDDLKTFAKNDEEQQRILAIVKAFSDDVKMEFGLEKCAKATFKKGKLTSTESMNLGLDTVIQDLEQDSTYKYLGINEGDGIQHATMKEKIRKEYYRRIRLVLGSELNAVNRTNAINTPGADPDIRNIRTGECQILSLEYSIAGSRLHKSNNFSFAYVKTIYQSLPLHKQLPRTH